MKQEENFQNCFNLIPIYFNFHDDDQLLHILQTTDEILIYSKVIHSFIKQKYKQQLNDMQEQNIIRPIWMNEKL